MEREDLTLSVEKTKVVALTKKEGKRTTKNNNKISGFTYKGPDNIPKSRAT